MATSGVIKGVKYKNEPYLVANWAVIETNTSSNQSKVQVVLKLVLDKYNIDHVGARPGKITITPGGSTNVTHSKARQASNGGTWTIGSYETWVGHDTNGNRTVKIDCEFDFQGLWWGNSNRSLHKLYVSGSANLDPIVRSSTLEGITINNSTLSSGYTRTLTATVNKKNGNSNDILQLFDGGKFLAEWQNLRHGEQQLTLSSDQVNAIIKQMGTSTSKKIQAKLSSRSRNDVSKFLGGYSTQELTVYLSSNESRPRVLNTVVGIYGNGKDKDIGQYIQGKSRAVVSFSVTGGTNSTVTNASATISDGGKEESFGSLQGSQFSGVTPVITSSGSVTIRMSVTNSRGETATETRSIDVTNYAPPKINSFTATRNGTNISIKYSGVFHNLGTYNSTPHSWNSNYVNNNSIRMVLKSKESSRSNFSIVGSQRTRNTGTSFSESYDVTNFDTTKSYDLRLEVTDGFFTVSSQVSVSTGKVLFSLKKDIGIGVGKYHQNGVLDIEGDVYVNGSLKATSLNAISLNVRNFYPRKINASSSINTEDSISAEKYISADEVLALSRITVGANEVISSGSNNNGMYTKFYDGTLICWNRHISLGKLNANGGGSWGYPHYTEAVTWTFPHAFNSLPSVVVSAKVKGTTGIAKYGDVGTEIVQGIEIIRANGAGNSNVNVAVSAIAIGKWK